MADRAWETGACEARSYTPLHHLRQQATSYDILHVHECKGLGFFPIRARQQALALANTTIIVQCHGPTGWALEVNGHRFSHEDQLQDRCGGAGLRRRRGHRREPEPIPARLGLSPRAGARRRRACTSSSTSARGCCRPIRPMPTPAPVRSRSCSLAGTSSARASRRSAMRWTAWRTGCAWAMSASASWPFRRHQRPAIRALSCGPRETAGLPDRGHAGYGPGRLDQPPGSQSALADGDPVAGRLARRCRTRSNTARGSATCRLAARSRWRRCKTCSTPQHRSYVAAPSSRSRLHRAVRRRTRGLRALRPDAAGWLPHGCLPAAALPARDGPTEHDHAQVASTKFRPGRKRGGNGTLAKRKGGLDFALRGPARSGARGQLQGVRAATPTRW